MARNVDLWSEMLLRWPRDLLSFATFSPQNGIEDYGLLLWLFFFILFPFIKLLSMFSSDHDGTCLCYSRVLSFPIHPQQHLVDAKWNALVWLWRRLGWITNRTATVTITKVHFLRIWKTEGMINRWCYACLSFLASFWHTYPRSIQQFKCKLIQLMRTLTTDD